MKVITSKVLMIFAVIVVLLSSSVFAAEDAPNLFVYAVMDGQRIEARGTLQMTTSAGNVTFLNWHSWPEDGREMRLSIVPGSIVKAYNNRVYPVDPLYECFDKTIIQPASGSVTELVVECAKRGFVERFFVYLGHVTGSLIR